MMSSSSDSGGPAPDGDWVKRGREGPGSGDDGTLEACLVRGCVGESVSHPWTTLLWKSARGTYPYMLQL